MPPPQTDLAGKRRARRASDAGTASADGILPEDDAELIATLAARLITAEQARKRAEERERESRARADAVEARVADGAAAPALISDLARRLSEVGVQITAREATLERELAEIRAMRRSIAELSELSWRLAGPAAAARIPALAMTDPPPSRASRAPSRTTPGIRRPR